MGELTEVSHRWVSEDARKLYEAYAEQLREMQRKRAVDLGLSMDDGDEQTATALLKQNRKLRMSDEHRAEINKSWDEIMKPLIRRMCDVFSTGTVPVVTITR